MTPDAVMAFSIRSAVAGDAVMLPAIENSAGLRFREIPELAWIADGEDHSARWYASFIAHGASWIAHTASGAVGFLCADMVGDTLHIEEIAVRTDWQGHGIGGGLMETALSHARQAGLKAATLTTFRDVRWNAPFYAKFGFVMMDTVAIGARLAACPREEAERGLPASRRCAMRLALQ